MTFLNKKEQVLDIELTQYGKYLLSRGQLKPTYYAFYDDDILYDSEYAGFTEAQNETEGRIKESPRSSAQYLFGGAETAVFSNNSGEALQLMPGLWGADAINAAPKPQFKPDKLLSPQIPLGTSDTNNKYLPAWNVDFLHGDLLWSSSTLTSSAYVPVEKRIPLQKIPQLNTKIEYKKWLFPDGISQDQVNSFSKDGFVSEKFADGSVLAVEKDFLVLQIEEKNGFYEKENFDIEIFEVITTEVDSEGRAITTEEQSLLFLGGYTSEPQEHHVDYYFDVLTDLEIDSEIMCELLKDTKNKNILLDSDQFDCEDLENRRSRDIYIDTNEFEESCD